ncbi:MAG TPA: GNAT family N-acetyltransferase [Actinomycetes bacterium]
MSEVLAPRITLPRRRGAVVVRQGGLDDDLDALHVGDPLWWGQSFVAERIASSPPEDPWLILVAELDSEPVGYAFLLSKGVNAGGRAMADLYVLPTARGRGAGRALLEALTAETAAHGLPGFLLSLPDDDLISLGTARHWGLQVTGHHKESLLDLNGLDDDEVARLVARAASAGIALEPMIGSADEAAWQEVYQMVVRHWADAPDAEGSVDSMPFSVWRGFFPDPSYVLVARRDGEPVGATMVMDRAKDAALNTMFTGVEREVRGVGLATALKARHAQLMRDAGHRRLYTQNMDQNAPILAANDRLRFRVESGYLDVAYDLPEDPPRG